MSEIKVMRSEVHEERYSAYFDQKQLEQMIVMAVAHRAGLNLDDKHVYVKTVYISSRDTSTGHQKEARCEIVVDRRPRCEEA